MINYTPFPNVIDKLNNNELKFSIDTLRVEVRKNTMNKYCNKNNYEISPIKNHSKISINAKKELWTKEVTSKYQLITPDYKNVTLSTPHYLNQSSGYKKYFLVTFGLSQPKKPLSINAMKNVEALYNKFGVDSFDLSIDSTKPLNEDSFGLFGLITRCNTTIYINNPIGFPHISKMCYYDKAYKDGLHYPLYRLELKINTFGKLGNMFIPISEIVEVIESII